jgi:hypothetical protein
MPIHYILKSINATALNFILSALTFFILFNQTHVLADGPLTPIARFDVVPHQRISKGEVFNVGVVAFSKAGIDKVVFHISGQSYTGTNPVTVSDISYNPRTKVHEYWFPLRADDFQSDGPIQIEAVVYGTDSGTRDKNWLIDDSFGATYGLDCWVDSNGGHNYYCNVTSDNLFDESMIYSEIYFYKSDDNWWNGVNEYISSATANTLTFHYATSWGENPTTIDHAPQIGDKFVLTRGFGLDPLVLIVNPNGTLPAPIAYVDTQGNDSNGIVNNPNHPYATVGAAMKGVQTWMSTNGHEDKISGGIIKLNPGTHTQSNGGFSGSVLSKDEWLTIMANDEVGGNKTNTTLYAGSFLNTEFVKACGLTISSENNGSDAFAVASTFRHKFNIWIDDCNLVGHTKFNELAIPVTAKGKWFTNTYFTNMGKAVSAAKLARNLTIEHIGDDVFVKSPFGINIKANDVNPRDGTCVGGGCAHADCWQWWGSPIPHNMIIYNFDCRNCTYQGIFARTQDGNTPEGYQTPKVEGAAIINMRTELVDDPVGAKNAWYISTSHMLMWHNTFNHEFNFWNDGDGSGRFPLNIEDFDVVGNSFFNVELNAGQGDDNGGDPQAPGIDLSSWRHNHYLEEAGTRYYIETPGVDISVGNPMTDASAVPLETSPLVDRVEQMLVPVDANGNLRTDASDIGAFEYNASPGNTAPGSDSGGSSGGCFISMLF